MNDEQKARLRHEWLAVKLHYYSAKIAKYSYKKQKAELKMEGVIRQIEVTAPNPKGAGK